MTHSRSASVCAGLLAKGALASGSDDPLAVAKLASARFFGEQILPTVAGLLPAITAEASALYALDPTQLAST